MSDLHLLVDVDALAKLSHWKLAGELQLLFGLPPQRIAALPSLLPRASRAIAKPDGKLFRNREAPSHLVPLLHQFGSLPAADPNDLNAFQDNLAIDGGEAVLLALAMGRPSTIVLTGDKRAIGGLGSLPLCVQKRLHGKILCLEHVILSLLRVHGLPWLRSRVCPEKDVDRAIAIAMGSRCDAPIDAVSDGLMSFISNFADTRFFAPIPP